VKDVNEENEECRRAKKNGIVQQVPTDAKWLKRWRAGGIGHIKTPGLPRKLSEEYARVTGWRCAAALGWLRKLNVLKASSERNQPVEIARIRN
jgi:hypothetical protein